MSSWSLRIVYYSAEYTAWLVLLDLRLSENLRTVYITSYNCTILLTRFESERIVLDLKDRLLLPLVYCLASFVQSPSA